MKNNYVYLVILLISMVVYCSCAEKKDSQGGILAVDVRDLVDNSAANKSFLADEIDRVDYVPLEITKDGSSLIAGILDFTVTDSFIYILPMKENRIMQFDRKGRFMKNVVTFGEGPG